MDRLDEWGFKSKKMELEEDFYLDYGAEEIADYHRRDGRDPDDELLAAFKQKEEEVLLAAQLGNALLLENRQLKEQCDKLHEQYQDKLEELEQGRHELRLKLEGRQSQWESQAGDLERDTRELSSQVEHLTQALSDAQRDKRLAQQEHSEHSQQLREQISTAMEVQRAMSAELQTLKEELRQRGNHSRPQDEELISAMREQVVRLTQKEQVLEERLQTVSQENMELRESLATVHSTLDLTNHSTQQHSQQLAEAWQEVEAARGRSQQLQEQVEELLEETSLHQARSHTDTSLLSELESSLDGIPLTHSSQQMTEDAHCVLRLLLPLAQEEASGPGEGSEVAAEQEDLAAMLQCLKGVAQHLAQTHCCAPQKAHVLEQNAQLRQQLKQVTQDQAEVTQQAIRDRDEAIAKKNLMEAELVRSKNDMMCLNNQLLEAIQRKLELSQELEAWQDDIQIILNQQLKSQQQSEQLQRKPTPSSSAISFFRRPSAAPSAWTRPHATLTPCASDADKDKAQSPWREWLRRGKGAQHGK